MLYSVMTEHPRRVVRARTRDDPGLEKFSICCGTKTGYPSCSRKSRQSDFQEFGTGIVVYFQFIKYLTVMFIILALLSIPSMIVFFSGDTSGFEPGFKSIITVFSVANLGNTP
jgi:hypothetical protein